ncbi:MAG: tetratricopeptide repeat protein [Flavobacteriaceae bacterium]
MKFKHIIRELQRRNVPKAALAYLVVAWMIIQVSSILLPTFDAPAYVMQSIVICLLIGFPLWVVFSWIYDISAKGIKKTGASTDVPVKIDTRIGQRLNRIIITALTIAVVLLLYNQFLIQSDRSELSNGLEGTIAVLPFINNKPDPESDYFGFAIANQIIGDLNYLKNITVRSSSTIRKYDQKVPDLAELKEDLNVEYVLVGNYINEGNRFRLNVELIELEELTMIWRSDNIEVDFSNTFALQDIVAKKVVDGLNIKFSKKELDWIEKDIPKNPLAYEYYLRSSSYPLTSEGDQLAIEMLKKSVELDSTYAPAYGDLGFRMQRLAHFEMLERETVIATEQYYLQALELNPQQLSALGYLVVFYTETARTEEALEITRRMIDINPNNASARFSLGYLYRYIGMIDESISEMEKAIEIDPKNPNYSRIGVSYLSSYQYEKALNAFRMGKNTSYAQIWQGITLYRMGKFDEALPYFDILINKQIEPYMAQSSLAFKSVILDDVEGGLKATRILENADHPDSEGWYYMSAMYLGLGDKESSLRCLQEAVNRGYYNYPLIISDPLLEPIRDDPAYKNIVDIAKDQHLYFKKKFSG